MLKGKAGAVLAFLVAAVGIAALGWIVLKRSAAPSVAGPAAGVPPAKSPPGSDDASTPVSAGRIPPPRRPWGPKLRDLRKTLEECLAKGDYTTARKLARELESEASGDESMDVKAYVNGVLLLIADKRRSEAYAPIRQAVSLPEARAILERLSQPLDPSAKEELYFQLQSSRLPDEILPEVLAHLQDKIKESGDNRRYLGLLNSFVCPESEVALLGFVGSSYDRSVRVQALGLLSQRPYSDGRAALLSKILSSEADDEVRANLMMQLSDSPQAQLREVVRGALGDSSDKVRAVAVGTLDPAADEDRKKLLQVAQGDGSGEVRVSALHRLAKGLSQPATLNMVLLAAENDPADPVRVEAIRILGRSAPEQLPMVQPTLERLAAGNVSEEVGNMAKAVLVRLTRH